MALINCPECGKEISDKAISCPHCGNPMNQPVQDKEYLCCPKCHSRELHAEQKGFSGGKALAGAVAVGGIGLLAGTIGSKDLQITCLKCGNKFEAGKAYIERKNQSEDDILLNIIRTQGKLQAVKYYKEIKKIGLKEAKDYVDKLNGDIPNNNNAGCASIILLFILFSSALYIIL